MLVSCKAVVKFCLVYVLTILVLILVFTAFHNEPLQETQRYWWWGFLVGLILSISMLIVTLLILVYTDYNEPIETDKNDTEANLRDGNGNNSFKTVHTVSSVQTDNKPNNKMLAKAALVPIKATDGQADTPNQPEPVEPSAKFVNLTPTKVAAVTVVDVPAITAAKRNANSTSKPVNNPVAESANLATIPSNTLREVPGDGDKTRKTSKKKSKSHKKKKK